ncbi:hypothetical protein HH310_42460 [Actinoplanes sp. TBRC 11911]|uniref:hypothetical protein n=1 Tax=Actinoplanes sp. TBRC 11911 TaxID=2729386 RepID=UPI00145ED9AC|nr:hypothetical protein [Actinoplanes sp. TBRC 11911]NMO57814.1 hypothetical protein [Actinoplanes sp. TBRC 11911]
MKRQLTSLPASLDGLDPGAHLFRLRPAILVGPVAFKSQVEGKYGQVADPTACQSISEPVRNGWLNVTNPHDCRPLPTYGLVQNRELLANIEPDLLKRNRKPVRRPLRRSLPSALISRHRSLSPHPGSDRQSKSLRAVTDREPRRQDVLGLLGLRWRFSPAMGVVA